MSPLKSPKGVLTVCPSPEVVPLFCFFVFCLGPLCFPLTRQTIYFCCWGPRLPAKWSGYASYSFGGLPRSHSGICTSKTRSQTWVCRQKARVSVSPKGLPFVFHKTGEPALPKRPAAICLTRSPSSTLLPFLCWGEGSPTNIDCSKKLVPLFQPLYWRTRNRSGGPS